MNKDSDNNNNNMKDWSKDLLSPKEAWMVSSNIHMVEQMRNLSFNEWWSAIKMTVVFIIVFSITDNVIAAIISCITVPWLIGKLIQLICRKK